MSEHGRHLARPLLARLLAEAELALRRSRPSIARCRRARRAHIAASPATSLTAPATPGTVTGALWQLGVGLRPELSGVVHPPALDLLVLRDDARVAIARREVRGAADARGLREAALRSRPVAGAPARDRALLVEGAAVREARGDLREGAARRSADGRGVGAPARDAPSPCARTRSRRSRRSPRRRRRRRPRSPWRAPSALPSFAMRPVPQHLTFLSAPSAHANCEASAIGRRVARRRARRRPSRDRCRRRRRARPPCRGPSSAPRRPRRSRTS